MMALLHPWNMYIFLRKDYFELGRRLLELFMIGLMLKEKPKDGKCLGNSYFRSFLKHQWTVPLMMNLEMISFLSLRRKKKLPTKRGGKSKKMKNAAKAEDAQGWGAHHLRGRFILNL